MRKYLPLIIVCLTLLTLLASCEDKPASSQIVEYSTPTIKGTISIPDGSNVSPESVYVKVIDSSNNTVTIQKVNSDRTFVIRNLNADTKYRLLFTSSEPDTINRRDINEEKTDGIGGWVEDVVPATQEGKDIGSVRMKPLGTIKGKALVDGASEHYDTTVYIPGTSYVAMTDKDGNFSIFNVPEGTYTLRYIHEDCVALMTENVMVVCTDDQTHPEKTVGEVKLFSNRGSVEGRAVLGDSSDSTGITIKLESEDKTLSYTGSTSNDGNYIIGDVVPGRYRVIASYSTYLSQITGYFDVVAGTVTSVDEILELLGNFGTVKGSVSLSGSENREGIQILIKDTASTNSYAVITDADGAFTKRLKPGEYTLTASFADYASQTKTVTVTADETITIAFGPLSSVFGTVTGKSESAGETVFLIKNSQTIQSRTTLENREYTFREVEPGEYKIRFTKTDYSTYEASVTVAAGQSYIVNGEKLEAVYGSISGKTNSSGEFVSLLDSSSTTIRTVQSGSDCFFSFTHIEKGTYSLYITKEGYASKTVDNIVVTGGADTSVNTPPLVSASASVTGFVALEGGSDNSGVIITITDSTDSSVVYSATSAPDGSFRINDITKGGTYLLTYSKDGYVSNLSNSVDVTVGKVSTASSVTMKSVVSTVSGKVLLDGASTHEGITILLKNSINQYTASTDQKGEYKINRVLPGTYTLIASKDGYVTASTNEFVIESSSEKDVELLTLSVAIRSITGSVKLELLTDYAGALVTATNLADSSDVYSAITNSAGVYTLAGMTPGEYSIVISYTGYRTATLETVNVVKSTVTTIPLTEININRGTISGVAGLEGRSSSAGVKVELLRGSSVYETTETDASGSYSFYVPQGNYTGVRYSYTDFAPVTLSRELALFADNYISMGNTILTATHNSVYGTVDVLTTDDESSVTISFDGVGSIESYTTASDGTFRFDHVPVGSYTLRLQRQDCADLTILVDVKASDGINLGRIEVTPNTATIKGKVNLENGLSLSKVKVSVDMGSGKVLETLTDDSGRYEIGGVSIADEYTVTYSKNGWDAKTQQISPKLGILEVREMAEITLSDTSAPVISSVVINSGANTTDNKNITLNITAEDEGCGLEKIMVTYDNVFDKTTRRYDYSPIFNWELPAENGTYTVHVRVVDRSGNESASFSASIKLTDQKTEVSGVLSGDKLTWTVDKSPYLVTGSVMVEQGATLTINPGVDVQFAGSYGITVEGTLKAEGTETEKIKFYGVDSGENSWIGINCKYNSGSALKYVDVDGTLKGLQGYITVFNADIETENYALYGYIGEMCNSTVTGGIYVGSSTLSNNTFNLKTPSVRYDYYDRSLIDYALLTDNEFRNSSIIIYGAGENNYFSNMQLALYSSNLNATFDSCNLSAYGSFFACEFKECSFSNFDPTIVNDSNFIDCGEINITTKFSTYEEVDLTENFWGYANTKELDTNGVNNKHSFIKDYYSDSEFSITKAVLTGYLSDANSDAGYKGDKYQHNYPAESTTTYAVGDTGPAGGIVFYDKGYYRNGWRYLEVASSDVDTSGHIFGYYRATANSEYKMTGTSTAIGAGKVNTELLVRTMGDNAYKSYNIGGDTTSDYAAKKCVDYTSGEYSDWFLPSKDELNLIYENLYLKSIGTFSNNYYWSSSDFSGFYAWLQYFSYGYQYYDCRSGDYYVRPVRAF